MKGLPKLNKGLMTMNTVLALMVRKLKLLLAIPLYGEEVLVTPQFISIYEVT